MAKLIFTIGEPSSSQAKGPGVKRVKAAQGGYANSVHSNSSTLSSDLGFVFRANVKKVSGKR